MLKRINETMQVRMTLDEANHINALIKRDEAKAVVHNDKYDINYCPSCENTVLSGYTFCPRCGQRIDTSTYEL